MSIYSGFSTRKDQTNYNQLIAKLIQLLQSHLLQVMPSEKISNSKVIAYSRVITKMQQYEQHKYLPPKFSQLLHPLSSLIGIPTKIDFFTNKNEFQSTRQKQKSLNSQAKTQDKGPLSSKNYVQGKYMLTLKTNNGSDRFVQTQQSIIRKQIGTFDSVIKNRQKRFQDTFYISQTKIKAKNQRYEQSNQYGSNEDEQQLNFKSKTQFPATINNSLTAPKRTQDNIYGIMHLQAIKQAKDQLKLKASTSKQRHKTQYLN